MDDFPITVDQLRGIARSTSELPPRPWRAVELSHLEVHGPSEFDPDIDLSREAWEANEAKRAESAAWRGIVAADGTRILGHDVGGGRPIEVHDPTLTWIAQAPDRTEQLLDALRILWQQLAEATRVPPTPPPGLLPGR